MKKVLPLALCLILLFSLAGCGSIPTRKEQLQEDMDKYQFTAITESKSTLNDDRQIDTRIVYDNETKMVYYYATGYYKYNLTPYMRNGHYTYFDLDDGEIKEYN